MAPPSRGLGRERHTGVKAIAAALAIFGFVITWLGIANSHGDTSEATIVETSLLELPSATPTATATATAGSTSSAGVASPTATAASPQPATPTTFPRSRISRGS